MKASTLVKVATRSILRNKMRTLLTMLGIIIGVGAVIVMVAVGQGAQSQIESQIENLGTNLIIVTPSASSQGGVSRGAGTFNRLKVEDAEKIRRESPLLSAVSPVILAPAQAIGGQSNWRTIVQGVATDYQTIRDWSLESGAFFGQSDVTSMRKVAVIGTTVASALFPDEDPIGQQIRLRNVPFRIVGVLAEKGQGANGSDQDDLVLAPYTTVKNRLAGRMHIAQILASTPLPEDIPAAQTDISAILREAHRLAEWEEDDFAVRNQTDLAEAAKGTTEVMTLLLAAIASISLLVGGIGIMNIMLVSVTERTREIGLRKAVGARRRDILWQFLVEAMMLSLIGGVLGIALGATGAQIITALIDDFRSVVTPQAVVLATTFSAAVGLFFGIYPARRASLLNPIDALRYE